jgi:hypothetical protein
MRDKFSGCRAGNGEFEEPTDPIKIPEHLFPPEIIQ